VNLSDSVVHVMSCNLNFLRRKPVLDFACQIIELDEEIDVRIGGNRLVV